MLCGQLLLGAVLHGSALLPHLNLFRPLISGNSTVSSPEIDAVWTTVTGRRTARKCSAPSPESFSSTNFWGSLQNTHRTRLNHGARRRRPRHKRSGTAPERQFVVQALADLFPAKLDLIRPEEPVFDALPSLPWTPTVDDLLHRPLSDLVDLLPILQQRQDWLSSQQVKVYKV